MNTLNTYLKFTDHSGNIQYYSIMVILETHQDSIDGENDGHLYKWDADNNIFVSL